MIHKLHYREATVSFQIISFQIIILTLNRPLLRFLCFSSSLAGQFQLVLVKPSCYICKAKFNTSDSNGINSCWLFLCDTRAVLADTVRWFITTKTKSLYCHIESPLLFEWLKRWKTTVCVIVYMPHFQRQDQLLPYGHVS